jgi:HEAT repeat protein
MIAMLLGKTGAPRAAVVLTGMLNAKDPALVAAALDAIALVGPAGADAMILEKLADPDPTLRLKAATALAESGGPHARDELLRRLGGSEELDRPGALIALGGILARAPSEPAVARLSSVLELAAGPERDAVVEVLGRTKLPSALRALLERTREGGPDDLRALASVLAVRAGEPEAVARCKTLLDDADESVRAQAAWAAGSVGDESFVPRLDALAKAPDVDAAINATAAIGRIGARLRSPQLASRVLCPLVGDARPYVRANALTGLGTAAARCGDGATERRALAEDPSESVRAAAVVVVARAPSDEDKRALERCASSDRSGSVAHRCRGLPAPPKTTHAVTIFVVNDAAAPPRPRAPYALKVADGFVRAGVTDRRGAVLDPVAPGGDVVLVRPSGAPLK